MFKKIRKEIAATRKMLQGLREVQESLQKPLQKTGAIIYIDLGLHVDGEQLRAVMDWFGDRPNFRAFGFEANPSHFAKASALGWNPRVTLINMAVVGPNHEGTEIEFFTDPSGKGLGDSIFKEKTRPSGQQTIRVPCCTLSRFMVDHGVDPARDTVLLRMNIEGAELYVLEDLIAAGLIQKIDGFFGSWSDCGKLSDAYGDKLETIKRQYAIQHLQFNRTEFKGLFSGWRRTMVKRHMEQLLERR